VAARASVYVETSVVSYLVARPTRDIVLAAHQRLTRTWWSSRSAFDLFVSDFVLDEARAGDASAASKRLRALRGISTLQVTPDVARLAVALLTGGGLPAKATLDAFHVAIATANGVDYLLTWNCKHIANATLRGKIEGICRAEGFSAPAICTPEELPPGNPK
jgi:predicted nucleic acid-binding protein